MASPDGSVGRARPTAKIGRPCAPRGATGPGALTRPSVDARDKMLHGIDTPTAGSPRSSPALLTRSSHQGPHNSARRPPVQGMSQVSFLFP